MIEWYQKISNNCEKATWLIDKKNQEGISFLQHLELRMHLSGCSICRLYEQQSQAIDRMMEKIYRRESGEKISLEEDFKKSLEKRISKELKNK